MSTDATAALEVIVEEGEYSYALAHPDAGWGSFLSGAHTARVLLIHRSQTGDRRLVAEAEVRTDPLRPRRNALTFEGAAAVLMSRDWPRWPVQAAKIAPALGGQPLKVGWIRRFECNLALAARAARRRAAFWRRRERQQWAIGVLDTSDLRWTEQFPWGTVRWNIPPANGFMADPSILDHEGRSWVFFEHMEFGHEKGVIHVAELDPKTLSLSNVREVLRSEHHLAFPSVHVHEGRPYLLAEHAASGRTSLFAAVAFPDRWELSRHLLDLPGTDPALLHHSGRWWLFVTLGADPCKENHLCLFSAASLDDEFVPHQANPIRLGLRGSRMAGPILKRGGRLYRFGQDGQRGYGGGVVAFEITRLDELIYEEQELTAWAPDAKGPFPDAFHSFAASGNVGVVDGRRTIVPP